LWPTISGIFYIFLIGAGEELVSRGFAFGVLRKYGTTVAVIGSSILFGAMHLNVYTGDAWDPYHAYWHCLSAASFGALAAVVMIVTRSIIVPIVMHALFDWTVVFSKDEISKDSGVVQRFDPLWQTIKESVDYIGFDLAVIFFLVFILWLTQNRKFPKFLQPVLVKFGLLERSESTRARARKYLNPIRARSR
jgi:membrane protease YdiL (CAAX protease family)